METYDDDLIRFEAEGAAPLPLTDDWGCVQNEGARIWYAAYGTGSPVILLHGGLGNSEHDEFIQRDHAEYLARSIPNAEFVLLPGVSHFAPLQRPELFNRVMLAFLARVLA